MLIQDDPSVAGLSGGGFVVAWESGDYYAYPSNQDGDQYGIFAQSLDAGGAKVGPESLIVAPALAPTLSAATLVVALALLAAVGRIAFRRARPGW